MRMAQRRRTFDNLLRAQASPHALAPARRLACSLPHRRRPISLQASAAKGGGNVSPHDYEKLSRLYGGL